MRGNYKRALTGVAAVAAAAGAVWAVTMVAPLSASASAVADEPASLVEDFKYPNADQVWADSNNQVRVISGDGHILWTDCSVPAPTGVGRISIYTSNDVAPQCFSVLASTGLLNLEVAAVYEIDARRVTAAGAGEASAEVTTEEGEVTPVDLSLTNSTQVGVGADPGADPATLVQLAVAP